MKQAIEFSKQTWVSRHRGKPNGIWKVVNEMPNKRKNTQIDKLVKSFLSPVEAAEQINDSFTRNFSDPPDWESLKIKGCDSDWNIDITTTMVHECLRKLKIWKATGSDGIPARLLKLAASLFAPPLTHLFCLSISSGVFPRKWKLAYVIPIPKTPRSGIEDLRPISKLPICSKILEKLVLQSMLSQILTMYGANQFGFRPKTSTLFAHISIQEFVTSKLEDPNVKDVVMISFDMAKAFDKLGHASLMTTLVDNQLPHKFISWCKSYLQDRKQCVVINASVRSRSSVVTSGVPQGAVLAPFLFAAHMGSLTPCSINALMTKYADDVITLIPVVSTTNTDEMVLKEIENLDTWCRRNGLQLNQKKTKVMFFLKQAFIDTPLTIVPVQNELKVLGITYEPGIKWNIEISKRCSKASQRLFLLRKMKRIMNRNELVQIFNNYILSILEYCGPVFLGISHTNSTQLEKIQRRSHRIICDPLCDCNLLSELSSRRKSQALKIFLAMKDKDHVLNHLFPPYLPSGMRLRLPPCRTARRISSFVPSCTLLYNDSQRRFPPLNMLIDS